MHNIKNKNKSISGLSKKKNIYNLPKSINNNDCLAPCYPPNTIYTHPIYFTPVIFNNITCPILEKKNADGDLIRIDICDKDDLNDDYINFDIFEPILHIANTSKSFLEQIYNIFTIQDVNKYLEDSIDELPIYTQKRLLNTIYLVYESNISFPKDLFVEKVHNILKKIYKINLPTEKIYRKIYSDKNIQDIFDYFSYKYS